MPDISPGHWRELLSFLLAQRLGLNAMESALQPAGILSVKEIPAIRAQAADTAQSWSARDGDGVLKLLRVRGPAKASLPVPGRDKP